VRKSSVASIVSRNLSTIKKPKFATIDACNEPLAAVGSKKTQDAESSVTIKTDVSSLARNPVSVQLSNTSSKLELQLDFLARELELERVRREKL